MEYRLSIKESRDNLSVTYRIYEGKQKTGEIRFPIGNAKKHIEIKRKYDGVVTKIEFASDKERKERLLLRIYNENDEIIGRLKDKTKRSKLNDEFVRLSNGTMYYKGTRYHVENKSDEIIIKKHMKIRGKIGIKSVSENSVTYNVESEKAKYVIPTIIIAIATAYLNYARYNIDRYKKEIAKIEVKSSA